MKYVVTGGAGFIGSNLVDKLIELGHQVLVWDDLSLGKEENLHEECEFADVDIRQLHEDKIEGYEDAAAIFHLAALPRIQPSFKKPSKTFDVNVKGTINVLEIAKKHQIPMIYAGSSSFYHDPYANPYTFTKWQGEECCSMYNRVYGLPVAIARFFNVYGPRHVREGDYATVIGIFEQQFKNGEPLTITGSGKQRRDFTHVNDIVSGLVAISMKKWNGQIFDFGSGKNHSINELAAMFGTETKYLDSRPGEAVNTLAESRFSRTQLSWEPKESLEDYIRKFKDEGHN